MCIVANHFLCNALFVDFSLTFGNECVVLLSLGLHCTKKKKKQNTRKLKDNLIS